MKTMRMDDTPMVGQEEESDRQQRTVVSLWIWRRDRCANVNRTCPPVKGHWFSPGQCRASDVCTMHALCTQDISDSVKEGLGLGLSIVASPVIRGKLLRTSNFLMIKLTCPAPICNFEKCYDAAASCTNSEELLDGERQTCAIGDRPQHLSSFWILDATRS